MIYLLIQKFSQDKQYIFSTGFFAMLLAHIGLGVFAIGATLTSAYSVEKEIAVTPGERVQLSGYEFELLRSEEGIGPNYQAFRGVIRVYDNDGEVLGELYPERRTYTAQANNPMTEAAIHKNVFRDLYVALGEPRERDIRQRLRLYYRPFIRWICLLYTSPSPRDRQKSRMPSSA